MELINTNTIEWEDYKTIFLTEKKLKEYLMSEAIPCLSCRFKDPEAFYKNILFKIPNIDTHKKFKMIYTHLIHPSMYNYSTKEELSKNLNIKEENILAEGSVTLLDVEPDNEGRKPLVRWLILKE